MKEKRKRSQAADRIRKAYERGNEVEVEVIKATEEAPVDYAERQLRVCAYCRVSTEEESQQSSYELQVQYYRQFITDHENWTLVDIYADEGISGTSVRKRTRFLQMIEDCKQGKIDLIITKSISRFARNVIDCLSYVRELKHMTPPIGIFFETEKLNTLDATSEMVLTILSIVAQEESEQKSNSLKWSYRRRFKKGIPVNNMWAVMGYDTDENGNIFIVEKEAEIVRFMYQSYIEGKGSGQIARALTIAGIPTPQGKEVWSATTVCSILHNEKYCGDMRMQKTVTIDLFTHKVVPNRGIVDQYLVRDYHVPIVERRTYERVQEIFRGGGNRAKKGRRGASEPIKFKPIKSGILAGFVPIPSQVERIDIEQLKRATKKIKE